MVKATLTDREWSVVMRSLREALVLEDGGSRHAELSDVFHTLGTTYGYGED